MHRLSICIPTYNRAAHLTNCLQSIISINHAPQFDFEICVSDNCSTDNTEQVVRDAQQKIAIKYQKNSTNIGMTKNFLNVVKMADGEFVWLIGDDDLLLPNTFTRLFELLNTYPKIDFFYLNSYHLTTEFVFSFPQPFNTENLPKNMKPFSKYTKSGEMRFLDLIDPAISFDFLGGIFLSVFRRSNWVENTNALDQSAINDSRTFSYFDNTFPHLKIYAKAFSKSKAYFNTEPLSVCLTGAREWSPMQPLVMSIRLIEALDEYKKNGLSYFKYLYCKNYALNNFIPDIGSMVYYKKTGLEYINPIKLVFENCLFPNFYFSLIHFIFRKFIILLKKSVPKTIAIFKK